MKYYYALYTDKHTKDMLEQIKKKIEKNKWQFEIYLIALTKNDNNHLEIFNSVLLLQEAISKNELFLVGIASGYTESLELVEKITQEVYDETSGVDIRNYILQKQQKYEEGNV